MKQRMLDGTIVHVRRKQPGTDSTGRLVHQGAGQLSGKDNWYTPREYIESARHVMGSIDIDPASCAMANKIVEASIFYDESNDGLIRPWHGNVWLNPPYAAKSMRAFVDKLLTELEAKRVRQAILLTHNNIDTSWQHKAGRRCVAMCATKGRIRFYDERGKANSPTHGHIFLYFSSSRRPRYGRFKLEFSKWGLIWRPDA
jgi:ParB family transcriptional regulator, chromosome partitioning protein